jgi:hypothetical protein
VRDSYSEEFTRVYDFRVLLFPDSKIRLLEMRPCRYGQPVTLKRFPSGKSTSFG